MQMVFATLIGIQVLIGKDQDGIECHWYLELPFQKNLLNLFIATRKHLDGSMANIQHQETQQMALSASIQLATHANGKLKLKLRIAMITFFITCQSHQPADYDTAPQTPYF